MNRQQEHAKMVAGCSEVISEGKVTKCMTALKRFVAWRRLWQLKITYNLVNLGLNLIEDNLNSRSGLGTCMIQ
jgi:hypothetical protein